MLRLLTSLAAATVIALPATASAAPATSQPLVSTASPTTPVVDLGGHGFYLARSAGSPLTELMTTDGTNAGTRSVLTLSGAVDDLFSHRGALYFRRANAVWTSDGTVAGTRAVATDGSWSSLLALPSGLYAAGVSAGQPALARVDPATQTLSTVARLPAREIARWLTSESGDVYAWVKTGVLAGELVAVQGDGTTFTLATSENVLSASTTTVGDDLYFSGNDAAHGTEPWVTDGTQEGTRLVADYSPGADSSRFTLASAGGAASAAISSSSFGVDTGIARLSRSSVSLLGGSGLDRHPEGEMRTIGDDLYVALAPPSWTSGSTVYRVSPTDTALQPTPIAFKRSSGGLLLGGARGLYLVPAPDESGDLWWSDGEQAPIVIARPGMEGSRGMTSASVTDLSAAGALTYFTALDRSGGQYLWRSDGTPDGTWPIVPAPPRTEMTLRYSEPAFDVAQGFFGNIAFPSRAEERCKGKVTVTVRRKGKLVDRLRLTVRWTGQICFWQKNISTNRFRKRSGGYTARATFGSGSGLSKSSTVSW